MKLEEDATWAGKTEQMYVELWFNLPAERRTQFAGDFAEFMQKLEEAVDPMALGSTWDVTHQLWRHDVRLLRFMYAARRDSKTGEWVVIMDSFYLIAEKG